MEGGSGEHGPKGTKLRSGRVPQDWPSHGGEQTWPADPASPAGGKHHGRPTGAGVHGKERLWLGPHRSLALNLQALGQIAEPSPASQCREQSAWGSIPGVGQSVTYTGRLNDRRVSSHLLESEVQKPGVGVPPKGPASSCRSCRPRAPLAHGCLPPSLPHPHTTSSLCVCLGPNLPPLTRTPASLVSTLIDTHSPQFIPSR